MKNINPYPLGICAAYFMIGIHQCLSDVMFSHKIYLTVSIVSLCISINELFKILYKYSKVCLLRCENSEHFSEQCWKKFRQIDQNDSPEQKEMYLQFQKSKKSLEFVKRIERIVSRISEISISLGYACSIYFLVTIQWKDIPNDFSTNKINGVLTLFCFGFMFLTLIANEAIDKSNIDYDLKQRELNNRFDKIFLERKEAILAEEEENYDLRKDLDEK